MEGSFLFFPVSLGRAGQGRAGQGTGHSIRAQTTQQGLLAGPRVLGAKVKGLGFSGDQHGCHLFMAVGSPCAA